jgi:hypothetical protein
MKERDLILKLLKELAEHETAEYNRVPSDYQLGAVYAANMCLMSVEKLLKTLDKTTI